MYEWNEDKNEQNLSKHGLSFEDADIVFSGPCVTFEDTRYDYGEERFIALGLLEGRVVVKVVWWSLRIRRAAMNADNLNEKGQ